MKIELDSYELAQAIKNYVSLNLGGEFDVDDTVITIEEDGSRVIFGDLVVQMVENATPS